MPAIYQNPAQIRAAHALQSAKHLAGLKDDDESNPTARFASLVARSGLLPALAFALETKEKNEPKRPAFARIADELAKHLSVSPVNGNLTGTTVTGIGLFANLVSKDSTHLRHSQTEALAFLSYLKRFN